MDQFAKNVGYPNKAWVTVPHCSWNSSNYYRLSLAYDHSVQLGSAPNDQVSPHFPSGSFALCLATNERRVRLSTDRAYTNRFRFCVWNVQQVTESRFQELITRFSSGQPNDENWNFPEGKQTLGDWRMDGCVKFVEKLRPRQVQQFHVSVNFVKLRRCFYKYKFSMHCMAHSYNIRFDFHEIHYVNIVLFVSMFVTRIDLHEIRRSNV